MSATAEPLSTLHCRLCSNKLQDPRILPCVHSFCFDCLKGYLVSNQVGPDGTFRCPQCRHRCVIPEGGMENFPESTYVKALQEVMPVYHQQPGLEQIPHCGRHQTKEVTKYCNTCLLPACADCMVEKHQGHETEALSSAETRLKKELADVSKMAGQRLEALQAQKDDLQASQKIMEEEFDEVEKDIEDTAQAMYQMIEQQKKMLQEKLRQKKLLHDNVKRPKMEGDQA